MNDLLKKGFLLGLGAAVTSKEKVEKYLQELVTKGRVTPQEADELYDSLVKKGEETEEQWSRRSKERVRSMLDDYGFVTKEDYLKLLERVNKLEEQFKQVVQHSEHLDENKNNKNDL